MVLATQAVEDLASATLLRTVVESCPTTLLLANPALDRQQYAELFRLNAVQLEQLATLTPRRAAAAQARPDVEGPDARRRRGVVLALHEHTDGSRPFGAGRAGTTPDERARRQSRAGLRRECTMRMRCVDDDDDGRRAERRAARAGRHASVGVREVAASERGVISLATKIRYTTHDHPAGRRKRFLTSCAGTKSSG